MILPTFSVNNICNNNNNNTFTDIKLPDSPKQTIRYQFRKDHKVNVENCSLISLDPMDVDERIRQVGSCMLDPSTEYHRFYLEQNEIGLTCRSSAMPSTNINITKHSNQQSSQTSTIISQNKSKIVNDSNSSKSNFVIIPITNETAAKLRTIGIPSRLFMISSASSTVGGGGSNFINVYTAIPLNLPISSISKTKTMVTASKVNHNPPSTFVIVNSNTFNFNNLTSHNQTQTNTLVPASSSSSSTPLFTFVHSINLSKLNVDSGGVQTVYQKIYEEQQQKNKISITPNSIIKYNNSILSPPYSPPNCQTSVTVLSKKRTPKKSN